MIHCIYRHRGSGASVGRDGSTRSVRENTMLSFQKAAVNHTDFIEFDVHVTADAEVVVHHDFDVKLAVGRETISLGIPALTYAQLSRSDPSPSCPMVPQLPVDACPDAHAVFSSCFSTSQSDQMQSAPFASPQLSLTRCNLLLLLLHDSSCMRSA